MMRLKKMPSMLRIDPPPPPVPPKKYLFYLNDCKKPGKVNIYWLSQKVNN
jgi:hypothetical protein